MSFLNPNKVQMRSPINKVMTLETSRVHSGSGKLTIYMHLNANAEYTEKSVTNILTTKNQNQNQNLTMRKRTHFR